MYVALPWTQGGAELSLTTLFLALPSMHEDARGDDHPINLKNLVMMTWVVLALHTWTWTWDVLSCVDTPVFPLESPWPCPLPCNMELHLMCRRGSKVAVSEEWVEEWVGHE